MKPRQRQSLVAAIVVSVAVVGGFAYWLPMRLLAEPVARSDTPALFEIRRGESLRLIAERMRHSGIVRSAWRFRMAVYLGRAHRRVHAGVYEIRPGTTTGAVVAMFRDGKVHHFSITLVEGWTLQQVLKALREHPELRQTLPLTALDPQIAAAIDTDLQHPEGWIFPDTYYFVRNSSDIDLLRRAFRRMQQVVAEEWQNRAPDIPAKTPYEALILASIVEKETAVAAERSRIAGVFSRRLSIGMPLQTDPTIIYGLGDRYTGDLRIGDLRTDTPYNTYLRRGLPPTPIANPGRAAIRSALHPAAGDALYFVARGDGTHQFSATLAEHNRAVQQYQKRKEPHG